MRIIITNTMSSAMISPETLHVVALIYCANQFKSLQKYYDIKE